MGRRVSDYKSRHCVIMLCVSLDVLEESLCDVIYAAALPYHGCFVKYPQQVVQCISVVQASIGSFCSDNSHVSQRQVYTSVTTYRGQVVALKTLVGIGPDMSRAAQKEMRAVSIRDF